MPAFVSPPVHRTHGEKIKNEVKSFPKGPYDWSRTTKDYTCTLYVLIFFRPFVPLCLLTPFANWFPRCHANLGQCALCSTFPANNCLGITETQPKFILLDNCARSVDKSYTGSASHVLYLNDLFCGAAVVPLVLARGWTKKNYVCRSVLLLVVVSGPSRSFVCGMKNTSISPPARSFCP